MNRLPSHRQAALALLLCATTLSLSACRRADQRRLFFIIVPSFTK